MSARHTRESYISAFPHLIKSDVVRSRKGEGGECGAAAGPCGDVVHMYVENQLGNQLSQFTATPDLEINEMVGRELRLFDKLFTYSWL